jgi:hypothetical protein
MRSLLLSAAFVMGAMAAECAVAEESAIPAIESCCPSAGSSCGRTGGLVAGVEATFLKPNIKHDDIHFQTHAGTLCRSDVADFDELQGAPRIWLGYEGCSGVGVRARYWDFSAASTDTFAYLGTAPDYLDGQLARADLELNAYTFDLELTKRFGCEPRDFLIGGGLRYASREISEGFEVYDHWSGLNSFTTLSDKAHGIGLTGVLEGARRLGDSNFSLMGNARGSVLWGSNQNSYMGAVQQGAARSYQGVIADQDATTWIFEAQAGIRWERRLKCVCADVFSHFAFEYQYWHTDGCPDFDYAQSDGSSFSVFGSSLGRNVEFVGVAWAIGIKR